MAVRSGAKPDPDVFGKASIKAYLAAADSALAGETPDVSEARAQIAAARTIIEMFGNEVKFRSLEDINKEMHDGHAIINGRVFHVKRFRLRWGRSQTIDDAVIVVDWR